MANKALSPELIAKIREMGQQFLACLIARSAVSLALPRK